MSSVPAPQTKPCPVCGEQIMLAARKCRFCGEYLDPSARPRSAAPSGLDSLIIPVKVEPSAMAAGYLGLFSLFVPFVGFFLGIAAVILGRRALRAIESSPDGLSGRGRAIFGIAVGGLVALGYGIMLSIALVAAITGK